MKTLLARWLPKPPPTPAILLPAERFVTRRFEPLAGGKFREQASLAIEADAPFPPSQLLQGHARSPNGAEGLAYAAHRRAFGPDASAGWPPEAPVIPEFIALLGERPAGAGTVVHSDGRRHLALAWADSGQLPAAMVAVAVADGSAEDAAAMASDAAGIAGTAVTAVTGALVAIRTEEGLEAGREGGAAFRIPRSQVDDLDVRDPEFLEARQRTARWDNRAWRVAQTGAALAALALLAELAGLGLGALAGATRAEVARDAARVRELQDLQAISAKVEELGRKRPLPFEMLAAANVHRPAAMTFTAVAHRAGMALEIEARTTNAADIGALEQALSADPLVAKVETRDIRGREGLTTFALTITFRPEALRKAAADTP
jgi:hypothetical protein